MTGKELHYIAQAHAGGWLAGDGPFTKRCHEWLERRTKCARALLTNSGTAALEMAALLLDIRPGDEVVVPAFTFVSTVNAFVLRGARPVFIDIRPDTLNFDEAQFESLITSRTRAAVPVHYAGVGCEMDAISSVSARHGISVVEDNAHGFTARYRGRMLGTLGCLGAQSFHETKNISCGEGGALLVNRPEFSTRAEIIREKGTNRSRFFRGEVDKYTWVDVGSSYPMSDMLAAFLFAQLEELDDIQVRRRAVWEYYFAGLRDLASNEGLGLPVIPAHCEQSFHMFYLLTRNLAERTALIHHLKSKDIHAVFHYVPLHLSEMGLRFGGRVGQCPVTEDISERLVRLPFFNSLTCPEQDRVISEITCFYGR